jgi:15-cis-phytoene synthase
VSTEESATPLASFEAKWSAAYPEFGLALRFCRLDREAWSAFACLGFELEHAAFGIREMQPAAIKLQWWAEEFARVARGEARHPLTQALASRIATASIPLARWQEAIVGAFAQRDAEPGVDAAALLEHYARLHAPLGAIEASLFGASAESIARSLALTRALRETAALPDALRDGKLPLPMDLLARHRLARGDLASPSQARSDALRERLRTLSQELSGLVARDALESRPIGVPRAAMVAAAARHAMTAVRAPEPLAGIEGALRSLSIPVVWSAWRAARRSPA